MKAPVVEVLFHNNLQKPISAERYFLIGMPVNKMREMMIAGMLERIYTKEEILTLYFNTVPFGENCFGIEAGALRFFNKNHMNFR